MKVCVFGLWHLGSVTAACLAAAGHEVRGLDSDANAIADLRVAKPPVAEPGLAELVRAGLDQGRLGFHTEAREAVRGCAVLWVTFDTPVDDEDQADTQYVLDRIGEVLPLLDDGALVLLSSQLPVGTARSLERKWAPRLRFACAPENLRLGKALEVFRNPDRIVAGVRNAEDRKTIEALLLPVTQRIEWMSVESAEMTKHALNAFLAVSVTFANEIAALCEKTGADAKEVERGLKSESRIGPGAYLAPGAAFAGGTLARDVAFLNRVGSDAALRTPLLESVKASNDHHRGWPERKLEETLHGVAGKTVAVWGLTYKPGTDTLRRSSAVELCRRLLDLGAAVRAFDPAIAGQPQALARVQLCASAEEAARGADALVVMTGWPQFRAVPMETVCKAMRTANVIDPGRVLPASAAALPGMHYFAVGAASLTGLAS